MATYSTDIRVIGGLPVTVEYTIQGAEPDVGIMHEYVDEWYITHIHGRARPDKAIDWLYTRIEATKGEEDRIVQECLEHAAGLDGDIDYDY